MQNSHIALLVLLCLAGAIHESEAQYYSYYPSYSYGYYGYPYYNYYNYGYYPYYSYYGKRSVDYNQAPQNNGQQQFMPQQGQQQSTVFIMRSRSSLASGDRSYMHHKKQKSSGGGGTTKDSRFESMQRLRYLNKKPLCLQYNVQNANSRGNSQLKNKRKEQSFILTIAIGLIRLIQYLVSLVQTELWEFVSKPADQLFAPERSTSPSKVCHKTRSFLQKLRINKISGEGPVYPVDISTAHTDAITEERRG